MSRRVGAVLLGLVGVLVLGLAGAALLLPAESSGAHASRRISAPLLWGGGTEQVDLVVAPPITNCVNTRPDLDIVLLLDVSTSMSGEPLRQAQAAGAALVQTVDLTRHRVGLIPFAEQVGTGEPLTDQAARLQAALAATVANGGTDIAGALQAGSAELARDGRLGAQRVMVLLSDGGSAAGPALAQASAAAEAGIAIVVVGLRSADFDEPLLQGLATSGVYRVAESPADLGGIYADLGTQINQATGGGLAVREAIGPSFLVAAGSVQPQAELTGTQVIWHQALLTTTAPVRMSYQASTDRWGYQAVAGPSGGVQMVDCNGGAVNFETPTGPNVLVLPPPLLLALPLFVLGLAGTLPFAFGVFGRRPKTPPAEEPARGETAALPATVAAGADADVLFRQWIDAAPNLPVEGDTLAWLRESPVLFLGLGTAGASVLDNIATYLQGRCGPQWAQRAPQVRLLQVDVSPEAGGTTALRESDLGFPRLTLSLSEDKKRRFAWHAGTQWFDQRQQGRPGRATGRLAVYADLAEGLNSSKLWTALSDAVGDRRALSVFVVADPFSDGASGMIADMAHLLRAGRGGQIKTLYLCLAMQNAAWPGMPPTRRDERTFATLRELQRLQHTTPVDWIYAPGLHDTTVLNVSGARGPLFDEILLFDGKGEGAHDISGDAPEANLLPAMAGCLTTLLERQTSGQFEEQRANEATAPMRNENIPLEAVVGTMGGYALRLPVEEMRQVIEGRMLHQLLFNREVGIFAWESLDDRGAAVARGTAAPAVGGDAVGVFLQERGLTRETAGRLPAGERRRHLVAYLTQELNGDAADPFRWCLGFLGALRSALPVWSAEIGGYETALAKWIQATTAAGSGPGAGPAAAGPGSFITVRPANAPPAAATSGGGPLYEEWKTAWATRRGILERVCKLGSQRVFWAPEKEAELFRDSGLFGGARRAMRARLWWRWYERNEQPALGLLVLPDQLNAPDAEVRHLTVVELIRQNPGAHVLTPDSPRRILEALDRLAQGQSRVLAGRPLGGMLQAADGATLGAELEERATPLSRRRPLADWPIAVETYRYFTGPEQTIIAQIRQTLATRGQQRGGSGESYHFQPVTTEDPTECRLLIVKHVLPLRATDVYAQARAAYSKMEKGEPATATIQVFAMEQTARRWEEKGRLRVSPRLAERHVEEGGSGITFSADYVELLGRDEGAMREFGLAVLYGVLELDLARPGKPEIVGAPEELAGDPYLVRAPVQQGPVGATQAARRFVEGQGAAAEALRRDLAAAVDGARPADPGERAARLDAIRRQVVRPLSEAASPEAQDLALLLAAVLHDEERVY